MEYRLQMAEGGVPVPEDLFIKELKEGKVFPDVELWERLHKYHTDHHQDDRYRICEVKSHRDYNRVAISMI